MQKIIDRIAYFIKSEGISGRSFEGAIGASNGLISRAIKKGTDISAEWLSKIIDTFPSINPEWLLTGKGDMLVSQENISEKKDISKTTKKGNNEIVPEIVPKIVPNRKLQKKGTSNTNDSPLSCDRTTEIHTAPDGTKIKVDLHTPKATRTDIHGESRPTPAAIAADIRGAYTAVGAVSVPVVDIEAAAGGGAINSDYFDEADVMRLPSSMLPHTSAKRLCISVSGESMEPTIYDGTRIVVRLLDRSEWARIRSGEVYVVTDREGNSYVKRLRNNLETSGRLILTSDNPNQRKYTPLPLMEDEISNVWAVELVISDIVPPSERDQIDDLRDEMRELREWVRNMQKREK